MQVVNSDQGGGLLGSWDHSGLPTHYPLRADGDPMFRAAARREVEGTRQASNLCCEVSRQGGGGKGLSGRGRDSFLLD